VTTRHRDDLTPCGLGSERKLDSGFASSPSESRHKSECKTLPLLSNRRSEGVDSPCEESPRLYYMFVRPYNVPRKSPGGTLGIGQRLGNRGTGRLFRVSVERDWEEESTLLLGHHIWQTRHRKPHSPWGTFSWRPYEKVSACSEFTFREMPRGTHSGSSGIRGTVSGLFQAFAQGKNKALHKKTSH
jgi:hypothetical protein